MGRVTVRVVPRSPRDEVSVETGRAVVRVRAVPEHGAANEAASRALAAALGLAPTLVRLTKGSRSRVKTFEVEGLDPGDVLKRLLAR